VKTRLILKIEIKGENVVKPIYFEGLKKIGKINQVLRNIYLAGIDEIIYLDIVSSLYRRKLNLNLVKENSKNIFVPLTIGGGITLLKDCNNFFQNGADKVAINTHALQYDEKIINEITRNYGSQSLVLNIEAKKVENDWICYSDNGRCSSSKNILEWIKIAQDLGVGEILLQSVDRDGSKKGFDLDLYEKVLKYIRVPLIVASGAGKLEHISSLLKIHKPEGICVSTMIYEDTKNINLIKRLIDEQ
jgi:cyclase|tara:strand:+ start:773 stop:1510 length:738 start_codon:yes stop_codon:yes gene_type:complete